MRKRNLSVVHDEAAGFWTGRPWLVIDMAWEDQPAIGDFKTEAEAAEFMEGELADDADKDRERAVFEASKLEAQREDAYEARQEHLREQRDS